MTETSFRPDVFRADPPTLLGSGCTSCGQRTFPPRDVCPSCGALDGAEPCDLSRQGTVYSFTIVRQAPEGLETPYILGYVDLPEDRVRVMSRIEGIEPDELEIGMPVVLQARPNPTGDGSIFAFQYRSAEEAGS